MSTQPPPPGPNAPRDGAPAPQQHGGHAGPWILGAAVVLALGAIVAVLIHDASVDQTQTVITRSPTVNTTSVQPTITQATTTTVKPQTQTQTTTITQPPRTTTVTQPQRTVTAPTTTTSP